MKYYLSAPQKSSNPAESSLNGHYGLARSVAAQTVVKGMTAHLRIYEAALRLGMENLPFNAAELRLWLGAHDIHISMATAQRALVDSAFFCLAGQRKTGKKGRPTKIYTLVKPREVGETVGVPLDVSWDAPELTPVDLSSVQRSKRSTLVAHM